MRQSFDLRTLALVWFAEIDPVSELLRLWLILNAPRHSVRLTKRLVFFDAKCKETKGTPLYCLKVSGFDLYGSSDDIRWSGQKGSFLFDGIQFAIFFRPYESVHSSARVAACSTRSRGLSRVDYTDRYPNCLLRWIV